MKNAISKNGFPSSESRDANSESGGLLALSAYVFGSLIFRHLLTSNVVRPSSPAVYAWRKETLLADKLADVRLQRLCIAALGGTCRIFACKTYPCCFLVVVMSRSERIHRFSFSALFARSSALFAQEFADVWRQRSGIAAHG